MEHWAKYQCGTSILSQKSGFLFLIIIRDMWSSFKISEVFSLDISGFVSVKVSQIFHCEENLPNCCQSSVYWLLIFSYTHSSIQSILQSPLFVCFWDMLSAQRIWFQRLLVERNNDISGWGKWETPVAR